MIFVKLAFTSVELYMRLVTVPQVCTTYSMNLTSNAAAHYTKRWRTFLTVALWCGRGSCYGNRLSLGYLSNLRHIARHVNSKKEVHSRLFRPRRSSSATKWFVADKDLCVCEWACMCVRVCVCVCVCMRISIRWPSRPLVAFALTGEHQWPLVCVCVNYWISSWLRMPRCTPYARSLLNNETYVT